MTKEMFFKEFNWFLEFYEKKLNRIQSSIWYETFKDIPQEELQSALKKHIKTDIDPRFPAIGKIYELVTTGQWS